MTPRTERVNRKVLTNRGKRNPVQEVGSRCKFDVRALGKYSGCRIIERHVSKVVLLVPGSYSKYVFFFRISPSSSPPSTPARDNKSFKVHRALHEPTDPEDIPQSTSRVLCYSQQVLGIALLRYIFLRSMGVRQVHTTSHDA